MKITTSELSVVKVRRNVTVTDGPVLLPDGYRRKMRVAAIVIDYTLADGRFEVDSRFRIHLYGPWVKKDGTDAKDEASYMHPEFDHRARRCAGQYEWLNPIIDLLRPTNDLSMTVALDHEVPGP